MKKCKCVLLVAFLASFEAGAFEVSPYVGANVSSVEYKEQGYQALYPTAIAIKFGGRFNQYFAVEARAGTGVSDDSIDLSGVKVNVSVDNYYGAYAKGMIPISKLVSIYGLAGYTKGKLTFDAQGLSMTASDSSPSFGIGADLNIRDILSVGVEFARLFKGDGYEVRAVSVGVSKTF